MKFMQIKPQKCRGKFKESMWTDPAWSAENKEDGDRRIAQFVVTGIVRFTGTRQSVNDGSFVEKSDNLPHLNSTTLLKGAQALEGTVLDGEIVYPGRVVGGGSKYVTRVMGSLPERAVALQRESGWLEYVVFDCLWYKGDDLRNLDILGRRRAAWAALKTWGNKYVRISDAYDSESEKRHAWEFASEGLVFKHEDHTYGDERLWVKLKKEATADVVVTGFKPGKGMFKGMVGSIIFGQHVKGKLMTMGAARGFDGVLMAAMTVSPSTYRGRVFRIRHNGREPTGAFRHPRFDCWRDDKSPKDCVYDPEET